MHILFLFVVLIFRGIDGNILDVDAFLDDFTLAACKNQLILADEDQNQKIDRDEWKDFVGGLSDGKLLSNAYEDLPLGFVGLFISTSCMCVQHTGGDNTCCLRNNAHINLTGIEDNGSLPYFLRLCAAFDLIMIYVLEDMIIHIPSIPPQKTFLSSDPSLSVSPMFSGSPTLMPSFIPTGENSPTTQKPVVVLSSTNPSQISNSPSHFSTNAPSRFMEVQVPSTEPSVNTILEFYFSYGIVVEEGFTADDVLFERNNTVKSDIIVATTNITITSLNETYPCVHSRARSRLLNIERSKESNFNGDDQSMTMDNIFSKKEENFESTRVLNCVPPVYYSNERPIIIPQIFDDDCFPPQEDPNTSCIIIRSLITVIIIGNDLDHTLVRDTLVQALRNSFLDGSFLDALPK